MIREEELEDLALRCVEVALEKQGVSIDLFTEVAKYNAVNGAAAIIKALIQLGYRIELTQ